MPVIWLPHREDLSPVLFGDPHQLGDGLEGQLGGDVLDEVARPRVDDAVDDGPAFRARWSSTSRSVRGEKPLLTMRRKRVCSGRSIPGSICRIMIPWRSSGSMSTSVKPSAAHESLGVPTRHLHVGLLGEAPEPDAGAVHVPVHGVVPAQGREDLVMAPVPEHVGAEQVVVVLGGDAHVPHLLSGRQAAAASILRARPAPNHSRGVRSRGFARWKHPATGDSIAPLPTS